MLTRSCAGDRGSRTSSPSAKAMDTPTNIESALQENRLVFAYGPSIDISAARILATARSQAGGGTVFYAFKTNARARAAYSMVIDYEGLNPQYGLAVGDVPLHAPPEFDIFSNEVIFCSTGKLRNILCEQIARHRTSMFSWVMIESWDQHDDNAYVVANLARKHTNASITLLSCSKWAPLPYSDSVVVELPRPGIEIVYHTKPLASIAPVGGEPWEHVLYGPDSAVGALRGKVEVHSDPIYRERATVVYDTLKTGRGGRPVSKHTADVRADTLRQGVVYRLTSVTEFDALRARDPVRAGDFLDEAVLYLQRCGVDPLEAFGPNYPSEDVKRAMISFDGTKLNNDDLDKIVSLRMGVPSGLFYVSWTRRQGNGSRSRYIGGLIAALIEHAPSTYASLGSYTEFIGRNDIETLCNVWSSLILSRSDPFWSWEREGPVLNWCKVHDFNKDAILRLVANMKRVCLGMKGELGLFDKIKTDELVLASEVLQDTASRPGATTTKWDTSKILPSNRAVPSISNIVSVLAHGRVLDIYLDKNQKLVKPPIQAESVSIFYGL